MLTLFYLVWIGLLWLLHKSKQRPVAIVALALGAIPRAYIALAQLPLAWMLGALGYAQLIAFEALSALWLVYLGCIAWRRPAPKLALPMLILAAVEFLAPVTRIAGQLAISPQVAVQLLYCSAQYAFLRARVRESEPQHPQWSRL